MGTETTVAITPGSGANVEVFAGAVGDQQLVREAPSTAATAPSAFGVTTSNQALMAAAIDRRSVILWNLSSTATAYIRYDTGAVTTAAGGWHDKIDPGARLAVEKENVPLAMQVIGSAALNLEVCITSST